MKRQPMATTVACQRSLTVPCTGHRAGSLAAGYMRVWPADPPEQADVVTARLRAYGHRSGLVLAEVFVEQPPTGEGAAFAALVEALRRPDVYTVVIPSPEHFSRFDGLYRAMCTVIEVETGANVLIMSGGGGR